MAKDHDLSKGDNIDTQQDAHIERKDNFLEHKENGQKLVSEFFRHLVFDIK